MGDKNVAKVEANSNSFVMIDCKFLNCHICSNPLKRPVFKCNEKHFVCGICNRRAKKCTCSCNLTSCDSLDAILQSATVCCPYSKFGCQEKVLYSRQFDHEKSCPFDPNFFCPDCRFKFGTCKELTLHIKSQHLRFYSEFLYGVEFCCTVDVNYGEDYQIVIDEDDRSFLVVVDNYEDGIYVSLVCMGSKSTVEDLCYEISIDLDGDEDIVWSVKSSEIFCTNRWQGIYEKGRSLFLPSWIDDVNESDEIGRITICIRKKSQN